MINEGILCEANIIYHYNINVIKLNWNKIKKIYHYNLSPKLSSSLFPCRTKRWGVQGDFDKKLRNGQYKIENISKAITDTK